MLERGGVSPEEGLERIAAARGEVLRELSGQFDPGVVESELDTLTGRATRSTTPSPGPLHRHAPANGWPQVAESWRPSRRGGYTDLYVVAATTQASSPRSPASCPRTT